MRVIWTVAKKKKMNAKVWDSVRKKLSKDLPEKSRGTASKAQAGILQINANSWIIVQAMIYLKLGGYLIIFRAFAKKHNNSKKEKDK